MTTALFWALYAAGALVAAAVTAYVSSRWFDEGPGDLGECVLLLVLSLVGWWLAVAAGVVVLLGVGPVFALHRITRAGERAARRDLERRHQRRYEQAIAGELTRVYDDPHDPLRIRP